jgi:hypothetical protein
MAAETPKIVLVHGAWADATGFDAEIRALRDRGYSAIGFGNPLRDLAGDAAYLGVLRTVGGPVCSSPLYGNTIPPPPSATSNPGAVCFNEWMCDGREPAAALERFEGSRNFDRPVPFTSTWRERGTDLPGPEVPRSLRRRC